MAEVLYCPGLHRVTERAVGLGEAVMEGVRDLVSVLDWEMVVEADLVLDTVTCACSACSCTARQSRKRVRVVILWEGKGVAPERRSCGMISAIKTKN